MWDCPRCGEELEDTFEACWNCGTGRDGSAASAEFDSLKEADSEGALDALEDDDDSSDAVFDPTTGDLVLQTVSGSTFTLPLAAFEHMQRHAPLVARRLLESPKRDWGWPATKLAQVNPDAVMLHQVKCYHGEHHKGRLIATLDQLWWLERGLAGSAEQPLSYDWVVEVSKRSNLAKFANGPGVLGVDARRGLLTIGADLFQMHASEVDEFGLFLRQMQQALGRLEEQGPVLETEAVASSPLRSATPTALLKELAELRDLGIVTVDEFQAKKAELLSKEW